MRVVVLGGSGFIGKHTLLNLKSRGIEAISISRSTGCDIRNINNLCDILKSLRPVSIINCSAHTGGLHYINSKPATILNDNMLIILSIYQAAAISVPDTIIINPIANCSYPGNSAIQKEQEWEMGPIHESVLPFASTRRMIYAISSSYEREYGLKTTNWIVPNCYGPGDGIDPDKVHALNGIVIRMIKAMKRKMRIFELWGTGNVMREWVYVKDVAEMLARSAIERINRIYPLNLAQNISFSIKEITQMIACSLEYDVTFSFNKSCLNGAECKRLDDTEFRNHYTDYAFTNINTGIKETIKYYLPLIEG